ncbi:uncharacterized protein LOC122265059 [Penaeus japonicus]|uniref:uncharacterized protein LOC122265059 n=1 Tax=Penaeus japonicus TaxID=27405 RepID=UPI001C71387B|nr:uncharacterized protein LOC122265059 [Penaeus japonicus]
MRNPFRLEDLTLPNKTTMSELLSELTTQDTIHFWSFTNNGTATPLPAVLVTDTETLRQNPPPPCGSLECPIESWLTEDREDFLVSTVKALTSTLLKRQASRLTDLEIHLKHFEKARCVMAAESEPLERARGYIKDRFAAFGLDVKVQRFDTDLRIQGADVKVSGENIVGVSAGAARGPVLVVGADYDSGLQDSPLENNGAGVAALLEVARLYTQQTAAEGSFVQDRTVVFVAFDMNLKEYVSCWD